MGVGTLLGGAQGLMNIYQGLNSGTGIGAASAALSAGNLANRFGANIPYLGPASSLLGIYSGLKSGTPAGYINAASNVATGSLGLSGAGASAGVAAIPFAIAAYGASKPAYSLSADWWNKFNTGMQTDFNAINGIGNQPGSTTPNSDLTAAQKAQDEFGMYQGLQSLMNQAGSAGGSDMLPGISASEWQQLAQYGITPNNINQVSNQLLQSSESNGPPTQYSGGGREQKV